MPTTTTNAQLIDELFTLRQYADRLETERDALKAQLAVRPTKLIRAVYVRPEPTVTAEQHNFRARCAVAKARAVALSVSVRV